MKIKGFLLGVLLLTGCIILAFVLRKDPPKENTKPNNPIISVDNNEDFDINIIKKTNKLYNKKNYMISPLSIAYALSLVNEGALGDTKEQISNLLNNYDTSEMINIKNTIGMANLLFIKDTYKNDINNEFINVLQEKHNSEILIDEFKTPKLVNDWISKKTFNMINDAISDISPDFVLGLANAISIDVEWKNKFECRLTNEEDFIKQDSNKMKVAMMHSQNDSIYLENDNAKGIIKDYAIYDKKTGKIVEEENDNTVSLEYIAILPKTNINNYIDKFDKNELNNLLQNKKIPSNNLDINLSLPKYTYDFDYDKFQKSLEDLGMTDAFNSSKANFKGMLADNSLLEIYINKAIHKSHIELSENGTKAAAVTVFMFDKNTAMIDEKEKINIEFNKPFIYLIKEKNSDNIWFFGTVYEPMKWENNDTSNCK